VTHAHPANDAVSRLVELADAGADAVLAVRDADVGASREVKRRRRWVKLTAVVWVVVGLLWLRAVTMDGGDFLPLPSVDPFLLTIIVFFGLLIALALGQQVAAGRSPHVVYRPEQIDVRMSDVVGIDPVKDDVVRSLNLFLAHKTFSSEMGGTARRGLLFEGSPGTGKTHLARAMAAEAGVPFLFVSATSFQSMWYGATARKIRSYFKALRKAARKEGGAIGFIEEIDAIAMSRGGVSSAMTPAPVVSGCHGTACLPSEYAVMSPVLSAAGGTVTTPFVSEGTGGVVNELLVQMQSFDTPTGWQRLGGWWVDRLNLLLPPDRQLRRPRTAPANVLLIAATNRAASLDPALLRPGRFDRKVTFDLPAKLGRRALIDHFLARKAHGPELDTDEQRDALAGVTQGYSPVMIEHLLDEALVCALKRGDTAMSWADVEAARLSEEVGLGQPVGYTDHERVLIATHEAGHATLAWLTAPHRRLEILTIIKRKGALGLLAHGDKEDVYTRSRSELRALVKIAFGGQCAEEVFFGDVSTGPGGDLLYATNVAAEMVGSHGMDGSLVSYLAVQNSAFSDTNIVGRVLGDPQGRAAVERLLQELKAEAKALLLDHTHLVEALRDALLEREELIGTQITDVLEAADAQHRQGARVLDVRTPAEIAGDAVAGGATRRAARARKA
jgi:cell division protease FtsH